MDTQRGAWQGRRKPAIHRDRAQHEVVQELATQSGITLSISLSVEL
jgi:hypothetical protein